MTQKNARAKIVRTPGACGGHPRIAGTRITVDNLLIYDRILGDEGGISGLLRAYPYVTDRQIQVAFDSYRTHTAEIDHIIKVQNEQLMAVGEAPYDTAK